ncbi:hypothetical protein ACKP2L_03510 [Oenococcus alcoholitolerans]|uniref:hypothetical protein n=1 Tax=Oenococcus alcoholitolerans TaxID=931074 RepID=UPI003F71818E
MKNKQIKKALSTENFGEYSSGKKPNADIKEDIYIYSNSSQQDSHADSRNINTHFFDSGEYENLPENLRILANSLPFGRQNAIPAKKIADKFGWNVRQIRIYMHELRTDYSIPAISDIHGNQKGVFLATSNQEAQPYLRQALSRENQSQQARLGVQRGLTNGFLNKVNQWRHNHA